MGEFINPADVPKVKLYTGEEVPCVGMGRLVATDLQHSRCQTRSQEQADADTACSTARRAMEMRTRSGRSSKLRLHEGVAERKELYIMTKVWNDMHERVEESCRKSIADLQCDYIDMFFIHWPFPNYHAPGCDVDSRNPDLQTIQRGRVYEHLQTVRGIGRKRAGPPYWYLQYDNTETGSCTASYENYAGSMRTRASCMLPAAGIIRLSCGSQHPANRFHAVRLPPETGERYVSGGRG